MEEVVDIKKQKQREYKQKWIENNYALYLAKQNEYTKKYNVANKEIVNAKKRLYYLQNKETIKEKNRIAYQTRKNKIKMDEPLDDGVVVIKSV